jgi:hypothetical protein
MIFARGGVCSPRVLQSTECKNHSLPRSIYYFFARLNDFNIKKKPKICKLSLTVKLNLSVMLGREKHSLNTSGVHDCYPRCSVGPSSFAIGLHTAPRIKKKKS